MATVHTVHVTTLWSTEWWQTFPAFTIWVWSEETSSSSDLCMVSLHMVDLTDHCTVVSGSPCVTLCYSIDKLLYSDLSGSHCVMQDHKWTIWSGSHQLSDIRRSDLKVSLVPRPSDFKVTPPHLVWQEKSLKTPDSLLAWTIYWENMNCSHCLCVGHFGLLYHTKRQEEKKVVVTILVGICVGVNRGALLWGVWEVVVTEGLYCEVCERWMCDRGALLWGVCERWMCDRGCIVGCVREVDVWQWLYCGLCLRGGCVTEWLYCGVCVRGGCVTVSIVRCVIWCEQ